MFNFHPFEVVGRSSETKLMGEGEFKQDKFASEGSIKAEIIGQFRL